MVTKENIIKRIGEDKWGTFLKFMKGQTYELIEGVPDYYEHDVEYFVSSQRYKEGEQKAKETLGKYSTMNASINGERYIHHQRVREAIEKVKQALEHNQIHSQGTLKEELYGIGLGTLSDLVRELGLDEQEKNYGK